MATAMKNKNTIRFINSIPKDRILEYSERHHIIPRCIGGKDNEEFK